MTSSRRDFLSWFAALSLWPLARGPLCAAAPEARRPYAPSFLHPNDRWVFLPHQETSELELWDITTGGRVAHVPSQASVYLHEDRGYVQELSSEFTPDGNAVFLNYLGVHDSWAGCTTVMGKPHPEVSCVDFDSINIRNALQLRLRQRVTPDVAFKKRQETPEWLPAQDVEHVWAVALSPTGHRALVVRKEPDGAHHLVLHETRTGKVLGQCPLESGDDARPGVFALNEQSVAFFSSRAVWFWDWKGGKKPLRLKRLAPAGKTPSGTEPTVSAVHLANASKVWIALKTQTGNTQSNIRLGNTQLLELPEGRELLPAISCPQPVDLALTRDGGMLLARYGAGTIRAYDLASGRMTRLLTAFMPHTSLVAFGPSSNHVLTARPDGCLNVWHRRGPVIKIHGAISEDWLKYPPVVELSAVTRTLAWSPRGDYLAMGDSEGRTKVFDATPLLASRNWQNLATQHERQEGSEQQAPRFALGLGGAAIRSLAFHPAEPRLATLAAQGQVQIWNLVLGKATASWQAHPLRANAMAFLPSGEGIVTGGQEGLVLWDTQGKRLRAFDTETHEVCGLGISPDGNRMAAACLNGVIRVWDLASGNLQWKAEAHGGWASAVAFSPDGTKLASGGEDGRVCLWAPFQGERLASGKLHGHALAWSRDGQWLACNGLDRVRVVTSELKYTDQDSNRLFLDWADEYT